MPRRRVEIDDCDAYEESLAVEQAYRDSIIDCAFRDILRGEFDTFAVLEARRLSAVTLALVKA